MSYRNGYVSRRYLRERFDTLEYDMKAFLEIYSESGDDEVDLRLVKRCQDEIAEACDAIRREVR